jgi:hypothetical protein
MTKQKYDPAEDARIAKEIRHFEDESAKAYQRWVEDFTSKNNLKIVGGLSEEDLAYLQSNEENTTNE